MKNKEPSLPAVRLLVQLIIAAFSDDALNIRGYGFCHENVIL